MKRVKRRQEGAHRRQRGEKVKVVREQTQKYRKFEKSGFQIESNRDMLRIRQGIKTQAFFFMSYFS